MKFQNFPKQSNYRIERFRDIPVQKRLHKILKQTNSADKPASRMSRQSRKIIYKFHHLGGVLCRLCSRCSHVYLFFRFVSFSLHINKTCVLEHLFLRAHFVRICRHCPLFNFFCHRQTFVPRFLATIPHTGAQIKMASTAKARVLLSTG